jgi:hypothetical protein
MALDDRIGEQVELDGVAYDSHQGAIIEVDGVAVYLAGVKQWPSGTYGAPATVRGTLDRRALTTDPAGDPPRHGIAGEVFVLDDPQCELLTDG